MQRMPVSQSFAMPAGLRPNPGSPSPYAPKSHLQLSQKSRRDNNSTRIVQQPQAFFAAVKARQQNAASQRSPYDVIQQSSRRYDKATTTASVTIIDENSKARPLPSTSISFGASPTFRNNVASFRGIIPLKLLRGPIYRLLQRVSNLNNSFHVAKGRLTTQSVQSHSSQWPHLVLRFPVH
jgi:hypothetical protein